MQDYVVGFLFSNEKRQVVLIKKNKPEWQKGKLNGVGGKIERGETPHQAMVREFEEEAGLKVEDWKQFCTYSGEFGTVHFFKAFAGQESMDKITTKTDESIHICSLPTFPNMDKMIPNLKWLIPMALDEKDIEVSVITPREEN